MCRMGANLYTPILKVEKKGTEWPRRSFAEKGEAQGVVASKGGFGAVSLQAECTDARLLTGLGFTDASRWWGVKIVWRIPGRGCSVNVVKNVGFWAIKLAGERRERGNYASVVGTHSARGECGDVEESLGFGGPTGDFLYFGRYDAYGHEDHAERPMSRRKRVEGVKAV